MTIYSSIKNVVNCLRLTESQKLEVNQQLDKQAESFEGTDCRENTRHSYYVENGIVVYISHPGGTESQYNVSPRNLSRFGVGFLHGNFLYNDTVCSIYLPRLDGNRVWIPGKICRCKFLHGNIHEIGVKFDNEINPEDFIKDAIEPEKVAQPEKVATPEISE